MENKELLKAEYNAKVYSEAEKENFVREAVAQAKEDMFSDTFKHSVECLITKRLLDFCDAHPAIISMDKPHYPTVDYTA